MSVMAIIKRGEKFMELAAKIFIIIGMITGAMAILPLIFGFIVLNKMKNNTLTTGWKVVALLFVNLIGGILLLCLPHQPATPAN